MPTRAGETSSSPTRSSLGRPVGGSFGSTRHASTRPTTQNGTFTQKSQRQSSQFRMSPPMVGPRIGPSAAGRLMTAMSRPRLTPRGTCWIASVAISGIIRPPPTPCSTRKAMRLVALQARLHAMEATRKIVSAIIQSRLPPMRACAQPTTGIVTPSASR